jgi:hypothetical protein
MKSFDELPPVMIERAKWARDQILIQVKTENPLVQIDEDELLAWVFNSEDNLWYSVDGNYSKSSPQEKMKKRREIAARQNEQYQKYQEETIRRLAEIDYWSKIRQRVLDRDDHTCQGCQIKIDRFHIHHIVPKKQGGQDFYDNLITLCPKCHKKYEGVDNV